MSNTETNQIRVNKKIEKGFWEQKVVVHRFFICKNWNENRIFLLRKVHLSEQNVIKEIAYMIHHSFKTRKCFSYENFIVHLSTKRRFSKQKSQNCCKFNKFKFYFSLTTPAPTFHFNSINSPITHLIWFSMSKK